MIDGLVRTGLAALLLSVGAASAGYLRGRHDQLREDAFEQRKAIDRATAERDRLRGQIETAALAHLEADQARHATNREIIRETSRISERPVYRAECIDRDGVRLLDRAAAAANGADPAGAPAGSAAAVADGAALGTGDDRGTVPGQPD